MTRNPPIREPFNFTIPADTGAGLPTIADWLSPNALILTTQGGHAGIFPNANVVPAVNDLVLQTPEFLVEPGNQYLFIVLYLGVTATTTNPDIVLRDVIAGTDQVIEAAANETFHTAMATIVPTGPRARIAVKAKSVEAIRPVLFAGTHCRATV